MADTVQRVDYYYVTVPNRAGEGARVLEALKETGVNLRAVHAFPSGQASQIDFVPEDSPAFEDAAKRANLKLSQKKSAFLIEGDDRPGAVAAMLEKLGNAGVNATAVSAVRGGGGRYGAILWVAPADVQKAGQALGAR